jgi:DNA-binding response OmpR family regulator
MQAKIAVVDDDPDLCQLIEAHFSELGWSVVTCTDSHQAVAMILREQPDVVVLDVIMPTPSTG